MNYTHLMSPLTVKSMTLRNRVVMAPMGSNLANPDGSISQEHKHYYSLRAQGGTGLIIVENVCVAYPLGSNGTTQLRLDDDGFIPHLYELTEDIHAWGSKIAVQVNHAGSAANPARIGAQPISASELPCKTGGPIPRSMTTEEIYSLVTKYAEACKRAQTAGFDAVEIHAGHSYLVSQFLSPLTNQRTDEFGGSMENRVRFLQLILKETRKLVGEHFPIMIRISAEEFLQGGLTLEDTLEWLPLVNDYVDIYDVSAGLNGSVELMIDKGYLPDGWKRYLAKAIKKKTHKPCITSGNYRDPNEAEAAIVEDCADMVAIGRGLIADPQWCNKVAENRCEEIRKCISCCTGCVGHRMGLNRPIRCTVNPAVTTGDSYKDRKISKSCHVVVIGSGMAGLEAACTAAEVGCRVTLLENENHIGGRAASLCNIPEKFRFQDMVKYYTHRAKLLGNLDIRVNTMATTESVSALKPDLIVCATGSKQVTPPIPGLLENLAVGNILTADGMIENILSGTYPDDLTGKSVVIIGGGAVGLDIVEYFARKGAHATVVEMMPLIGNGLDLVSRVSINNLMREKNVHQMPNTKLLEVKQDCFVTSAGTLPFDFGFIALGLKSFNPLFEEMSKIAPTIAVGDAKKAPRQIIDGVKEGRAIINQLEAMGHFNRY